MVHDLLLLLMPCYHLPPGGVVDQSVLQQRAEHEEHAGTRPDVHRLAGELDGYMLLLYAYLYFIMNVSLGVSED